VNLVEDGEQAPRPERDPRGLGSVFSPESEPETNPQEAEDRGVGQLIEPSPADLDWPSLAARKIEDETVKDRRGEKAEKPSRGGSHGKGL